MPQARPQFVVAVDLGGSKIEAAMVSPSGRVAYRERVPTQAIEGQGRVVERLFSVIDRLLEHAEVKMLETAGICVAAAGPIDMEKGVITTPPNLPGWQSVPLRTMVAERYQVDSYLINDAKAAVLGEHRFGAGKGIDNLLCITLGTGIGGGIFVNGRLYLGQSGAAGEVGHMTIDINGLRCPCGNVGCWEMYASGTAMGREMARRLALGEKSSLAGMAKAGAKVITAEQVAEAAGRQDPLALSVIAWSAAHIGTGLVNLVNIFNPQMIVIGGGLSKIGPLLLNPAIKVVRQKAFPLLSQAVTIVPSSLGDYIAVLGAAAFAFQKGKV